MDTETRLSAFGLALLAGFLGIAVAFAVSASIGDGIGGTGTAKLAPVDPKAITRMSAVDAGAPSNQAAPAVPRNAAVAASGATRTRMYCANCAVVESMRRVERRVNVPAVCPALDSARFWTGRYDVTYDTTHGTRMFSLGADGAVAGRLGAAKTVAKPTYQIVVRFRDGSRHVFNEATPRTLQSGERVQVIAGPDWKPKGRA